MAYVIASSSYLPAKVVDNRDLVQFPEKYRDVIAQKAGIWSRRHVDDECTSDLGAKATQRLLANHGVQPESVEAVICATSSPDRIQPATATRIQDLCGLKNAYAFDLNSVCSSAVFAMKMASSLVNDGADNVLVVASEVYSKICNPKDLTTFPYFGDGSGAVLISRKQGGYELADFILKTDGSGSEVIQVPAGGTKLPAAKVIQEKDFFFSMVGRQVFEFACDRGSELIEHLEQRNQIRPDIVIPHQANIKIIQEIGRRTNLAQDKFVVNLEHYANTAGASVLIAFDEYMRGAHLLKNVFFVVFGGGLSWGGAYLRKV